MIAPFPFIIGFQDQGWPCLQRCEGNHFQMCINDRAPGERDALQSQGNWRSLPPAYFRIFSSPWHSSRYLLQTPAETGALQAAETLEAKPLA